MNTFGEKLKLSIFGESHGTGLGIVIDGLPPGHEIDENYLASEMKRRAPGSSSLTSPRKESDRVEILSGVFRGYTTGTPLCGILRNESAQSENYEQNLPRPGHADLTSYLKSKGYSDYRGGGHSSGRLTAPLVFAGAICNSILKEQGIELHSIIQQIGNATKPAAMEQEIFSAKTACDSVGGIIECSAAGLPFGLGSPFFGSVESRVAAMMFSIPGVKGIEFGDGFALASMRGSQANDPIYMEEDHIRTKSNHNGGINGGITNSMPLVFRVVIKPTPSIGKTQETIDLSTMSNTRISIVGQHDPCIVTRAVCAVEAGFAICLLDLLLSEGL